MWWFMCLVERIVTNRNGDGGGQPQQRSWGSAGVAEPRDGLNALLVWCSVARLLPVRRCGHRIPLFTLPLVEDMIYKLYSQYLKTSGIHMCAAEVKCAELKKTYISTYSDDQAREMHHFTLEEGVLGDSGHHQWSYCVGNVRRQHCGWSVW